MSLSQSGDELHRAVINHPAPTGGISADEEQLPATEDRVIEKVAMSDAGGSANVGTELSFSSNSTIGGTNLDNAKSQVVLSRFGSSEVVDDLGIEWSSGEELHLHTINNSGAVEDTSTVVYYREV